VFPTELGPNARVLEPSALIGDTDGASAAFQVVIALAHANDTPRPDGTIVLITSVDPDGQVGCGVFRVGGRRTASAAHRG
jgi:3-oxoacyl-[acyl-carrier-protein] synthase II